MDNFSQYNNLDDILSDDAFGESFKVISKPSSAQNADQRLIESFEEINQFVDRTRQAPVASNDINERKLYSRLLGLRNEALKCEMLQEYDRHNLLIPEESLPSSLDDILNNTEFASLTDDEDIFTLKHIPLNTERESADFVARRKQCKNFAKYEPLFKQCQADIKSSKRSLITFDEKNLVANTFFILNGQLGYLENISDPVKRGGNRHDGRTYCIFENGTESNMQFLSLAARLNEARKENQAYTLSTTQEEANTKFVNRFNPINAEDQQSGYIYVLKSKSTDSKITNIDNLYKIGYSTTPVEDRIKNAENEATYLMAAVEIVAVYQCYNMNPQKFEHILHTFFAKSCLNLDIFGLDNKRYSPREWFMIPLNIISQTIELVINKTIINYHYDADLQIIKNHF